MRACPGCGHRGARRSHRRSLEVLVSSVIPLRPYRCERCAHRFWWIGDEGLWASTSRSLLIIATAVAALSLVVFYVSHLPERGSMAGNTNPPSTPPSDDTDPATTDPAAGGMPALGSAPTGTPPLPDPGDARTQNSSVDSAEATSANPSTDHEIETPPPTAWPGLPPARASDPRRPELLAIRLTPRGHALDVELLTDERPRHWNIFQLDRRLVIDLQGPWIARRLAMPQFDHPLADRLRIGQHEDLVRVVVELRSEAEVTTKARAEEDRLRVTIEP